MFYNSILACLFFLNFLSAQEPVLIFRPQTPEEAFSYIEDLYRRLPWFNENGYQVALPAHSNNEIYDLSLYDRSLQNLKESEPLIMQGLNKLAALNENWGFNFMEKYEIVLTLYGPGGDYNCKNGIIRLFATPNGEFKRPTGYEVLLHEIVHIGIEETIVKKYQLSHWEKERLVDLICSLYLNEVLPNYKTQRNGDKRLDAFVDQYTIAFDLPSAMVKFVEQYPR